MGETKTKKKSSSSSKHDEEVETTTWVKYMQRRLHDYAKDDETKGMSHQEKMQAIGQEWHESDENPKNAGK